MRPVVFRRKRDRGYLKWGSINLAMAACCAGPVMVPASLLLQERLGMLVAMTLFLAAGLFLLKRFFLPEVILKLLPEGVAGRANVPGAELIPWACIYSMKLETVSGQVAIGIHTDWPVPMWRALSGTERRMLWKRRNRRQAPLILYVGDAAAPPEAVLHTMQEEWNHARERELASRPPEEGGTPL